MSRVGSGTVRGSFADVQEARFDIYDGRVSRNLTRFIIYVGEARAACTRAVHGPWYGVAALVLPRGARDVD